MRIKLYSEIYKNCELYNELYKYTNYIINYTNNAITIYTNVISQTIAITIIDKCNFSNYSYKT